MYRKALIHFTKNNKHLNDGKPTEKSSSRKALFELNSNHRLLSSKKELFIFAKSIEQSNVGKVVSTLEKKNFGETHVKWK